MMSAPFSMISSHHFLFHLFREYDTIFLSSFDTVFYDILTPFSMTFSHHSLWHSHTVFYSSFSGHTPLFFSPPSTPFSKPCALAFRGTLSYFLFVAAVFYSSYVTFSRHTQLFALLGHCSKTNAVSPPFSSACMSVFHSTLNCYFLFVHQHCVPDKCNIFTVFYFWYIGFLRHTQLFSLVVPYNHDVFTPFSVTSTLTIWGTLNYSLFVSTVSYSSYYFFGAQWTIFSHLPIFYSSYVNFSGRTLLFFSSSTLFSIPRTSFLRGTLKYFFLHLSHFPFLARQFFRAYLAIFFSSSTLFQKRRKTHTNALR